MSILADSHRPWAIPGAKIIARADVPTAEWLQLRALGMGGSDAASLMGESRWDDGTLWHCWATKTGRYRKDLAGAMARGHALEPIVIGRFRERTGLTTRRAGLMRSHLHPIHQASVDALSSDGGIVEGKTVTQYAVRDWAKGGDCGCGCGRACPGDWEWQATHYLLVTGKPVVHVVAVEVENWALHSWDITRDQVRIDRLAAAEVHFWDDYVLTDTAPPFDLAKYTAAEVRDRWRIDTGLQIEAPDPVLVMQLLHERAVAKESERAGSDLAKPIDLALKAIIGDASFLAIEGDVVLTYKASKETTVVDYESAWRDQATDLAPYTTTKPGSRSISVKIKPTEAQVAAFTRRHTPPDVFAGVTMPDVFAGLGVAS